MELDINTEEIVSLLTEIRDSLEFIREHTSELIYIDDLKKDIKEIKDDVSRIRRSI